MGDRVEQNKNEAAGYIAYTLAERRSKMRRAIPASKEFLDHLVI